MPEKIGARFRGEIEPKRVDERYKVLGQQTMLRFGKELAQGVKAIVYDDVLGVDVLQLESQTLDGSGERWRLSVERHGSEMILEQLYYSKAAKTWMRGAEFYFDTDLLAGDEEAIAEIGHRESWLTCEHLPLLEDDDFFSGVCAAVAEWPASGYQVIPLQET